MIDIGAVYPVSVPITLEDSYADAMSIMRDRATSFYQAFHYLPEDRFKAVAAVYAFCRYADDTVDAATEYGLDGLTSDQLLAKSTAMRHALEELNALDRFLDQMAVISDQHSENSPEIFRSSEAWKPAFMDTVRHFSIPIGSFRAQIRGQRTDADFKDCETVADLIEYSRLVAGSVGMMMLPILAAEDTDVNDPALVTACENLGIGMQITNILRDIGEDLRTRNRVYLPARLLTKYGLARIDLERAVREGIAAAWDNSKRKAFISLWEELSTLADTYYQDYEAQLRSFHPASRLPLVAAAKAYHAIADAVRENAYDCISRRCYTTCEKREEMILEAQRIVGSIG